MNASDIIDGRYRLERLLGTGGMAEVWLAEDQRLRRWVAVKALREMFSAETDAETIAAFEREATVIARLQHQNIVAVYDAGTHDGRRYIVMEYVHGYSLRQLLDTQGRMTEAEAIRYGVQVANALQYAHSQGVIHCDIKPENVIVNETGTAKVADFGVAETLTKTMTPVQAQDVLGTIAYLAPEIIEGSDPSPASDTYSLALTVFELVAGRTPFGSATAGGALGQRLATPAPLLRTFARGASPELEAILARALAVSPADRYASAGAFGAALSRANLQPTPGPRAPIAAPPGRPPQLQQRNSTARIRRTPAPPRSSGANASLVLLVGGILLAAIGVGVAAAVLISRNNGNGGDAQPTPTAVVTSEATKQPTATRTPAPPSATTEPTTAATPTATPTPTRSATATPTRTPSVPASPSVSATAPPSATNAPSATATP